MTSGIAYQPLGDVRSASSSTELHVVDAFLKTVRTVRTGRKRSQYLRAYTFDDLVRIVSVASNADVIEACALSDVLRQYLISNVIPAIPMKSADEAADPATKDKTTEEVSGDQTKKERKDENGEKDSAGADVGSGADEDDKDDEEEGPKKRQLKPIPIGPRKVATDLLMLTRRNLIESLENFVLSIEDTFPKKAGDPGDAKKRAELDEALFARLATMRYAAHLASDDKAVAPTDVKYVIDGATVAVPIVSKVAAGVTAQLNRDGVVIAPEPLPFEYCPVKIHRTIQYYQKVRDKLAELMEHIDDTYDSSDPDEVNANRVIMLAPGADEFLENTPPHIASVRQKLVGAGISVAKLFLLGLRTIAYTSDTTSAEEKLEWLRPNLTSDIVWVDVDKMLRTNLASTSNVTDMFVNAMSIIRKATDTITTKLDEYHEMMNAILTNPNDKDARDTFFTKLIKGEFCKRALTSNPPTRYLDDLRVTTFDPKSDKDFYNHYKLRSVVLTTADDKITPDGGVAQYKDKPQCDARFIQVNKFIDLVYPSILAPFYPDWEFLQDDFGSFGARNLVLNRDDTIGTKDLIIINAYVDYMCDTYTTQQKTNLQYDIRKAFELQYAAIFGVSLDSREEEISFDQRAARIAFQWDTVYFHMVQKYRHGTFTTAAEGNDWFGCLVSSDKGEAVRNDPFKPGQMQNQSLLYVMENYVALNLDAKEEDLIALGIDGDKQETPPAKSAPQRVANPNQHATVRIDKQHLNTNLLRERILAESALQLFGILDTKTANYRAPRGSTPDRIWLTSMPDLRVVEPTISASWGIAPTEESWVGIPSFFKFFDRSSLPAGFRRDLKPLVINVDDTKTIKDVVGVAALEKHVSIRSFPERKAFGSEKGPIQRHHVLFHQASKTFSEIKAYAKFLKKSEKKKTVSTGDGKEDLLDADASLNTSDPKTPNEGVLPLDVGDFDD